MRIQELMTKPIATCRSTDTLDAAARLMWDHDCGAIPVVREDGKLVGIITDRDICMAAYTRGGGLSQYFVASAMSKQVISLHPEQPVADVEKLMAEYQLHRIPIVDAENKPIGIVSTNDLAREATRPGGRLHSSIARVLQTIASICAPRPHAPATRAA